MSARPIALLAALLLGIAFCVHGCGEQASRDEWDLEHLLGLLRSPEHVQVMKEGFEEVSSRWEAFASEWAFADVASYDQLENRAMILHATAEELRDVYRFRADFYETVGADPDRNFVCGIGRQDVGTQRHLDALEVMDDVGWEPHMRLVGRVLARQYEGYEPWEPLDSLEVARQAFRVYQDEVAPSEIRATLATLRRDRDAVSDAELCRVQAWLYRLAAEQPDTPLGPMTLFEYVRSREANGFTATPAHGGS